MPTSRPPSVPLGDGGTFTENVSFVTTQPGTV